MTLSDKQYIQRWLWISLGIHFIGAIFNEGFHHYDEHFCILEWIKFLKGEIPAAVLNEDFHIQMRPMFPPYLLLFISKPFALLGFQSPFFHAFLYRLFSGVLGFVSQSLLLVAGFKELKEEKTRKVFVIFTSLFFLFPYLHNHPSSESWGTSFFALAIALFLLFKEKQFVIGFLFCLSFQSRYQMGLMIAGFGAWQLFVQRCRFKFLCWEAFGFLFALALCSWVDSIGYGVWTFPAWNYLRWQVLEGGAARNGVDPFWYYFPKVLVQTAFPLSVLILFSFIYFWRFFFFHPFTWITLSFFAAHLALGHKEERYLFPMLPFVPFVLMASYERWVQKTQASVKSFVVWIFKIGFVVNLIYLALANTRSLRNEIDLYKQMYPLQGTLYFTEKNPYEMASVEGFFYRPSTLEVKPIENESKLAEVLITQKSVFFFKRTPELIPELASHCNPIFTYEVTWLPQGLREKFHRLAHLSTSTLFECKL